ncbi:anti-anti-sigma factor [Streptomyces sp. TLI_146]|nr:anti-anti-sigma factor [Streptomyces sp. TLI_146]
MTNSPTRSTPYRAQRVIGGPTLVTLQGEIDILAAPRLTARLDALTESPYSDLLLDLRPVAFIDCAGLSVLCRARNRARAGHGRLRLISDNALFLRILRCTGLAGLFDVLPSWPPDVPTASVTDRPACTAGSGGAAGDPRPERSAPGPDLPPGAEWRGLPGRTRGA